MISVARIIRAAGITVAHGAAAVLLVVPAQGTDGSECEIANLAFKSLR
jgi:hypothetical protein